MYGYIFDGLVATGLILAFFTADGKGRLLLAGMTVLVFSAPSLIPGAAMAWISVILKALLGLGCLIYAKYKSMA